MRLTPTTTFGPIREVEREDPVLDGASYVATDTGAGLLYDVRGVSGDATAHVGYEALVHTQYTPRFRMVLFGSPQSGLASLGHATEATRRATITHALTDGVLADRLAHRRYQIEYGFAPQCTALVDVPTEVLSKSTDTWVLYGSGGWLWPLPGGDRLELDDVTHVAVVLHKYTADRLEWEQTPLRFEPSALTTTAPIAPEGPVLDELGQSTVHDADRKTADIQAFRDRVDDQLERAAAADGESPSEGTPAFEPTGYYDTRRRDGRWWLVTPDGEPFWSVGVTGVAPRMRAEYGGWEELLTYAPDESSVPEEVYDRDSIDYLKLNFYREFGDDWRAVWRTAVEQVIEEFGFNTVGDWSEEDVGADRELPYVRNLRTEFTETPRVYLDFPDVFHPEFESEADRLASELASTATDSRMLGYILRNEPNWFFGGDCVAAGMLYTSESAYARRRLAQALAACCDGSLADRWGMDVSLADVVSGKFDRSLTEAAKDDLRTFSATMVARLFRTVTAACREYDPNHLNLGYRFPYPPDDWIVQGMDVFDVFSYNCFATTPPELLGDMCERTGLPLLIGEYSFGSLDAAHPYPGAWEVDDQAARGRAIRQYLEHAAAEPWCVGAHYFKLYDMSAIGRLDGENANVGLLDVAHKPYERAVEGVRAAAANVQEIAYGDRDPVSYDDISYYRW